MKNIINALLLITFGIQFALSKTERKNISPQYLQKLLVEKQYGKFSELLQIPDVDLVDPSKRSDDIADLIFYNGLPLGDLLLRPKQQRKAFRHARDYQHLDLRTTLWKNGEVPYFIATDIYTSENVTSILSAIEHMNSILNPNVMYRPYKDDDDDYVFVFPGGKGCYVNVGCVGGPQVLSMSDPCIFYSGVIIHLFQHTLGLLHEIDRHDRDVYLRILRDKIPESIMYQYYKTTPKCHINEEIFDYKSIMFYPSVLPGNYNITIIEPTHDGVVLNPSGYFPTLSETDIKRVKGLYK